MRSRLDPRSAGIFAALTAAAALALLAAPGCGKKAPAVPATLAEAQAIAARTGKPILIDFFATW
jgi:hypothetical protein